MLDVARTTDAYRRLVVADLSAPPVGEPRFGGSVSAGTFVHGHLGADAVPGLLAMLRPAATIAWTVSPDLWPSISQALTEAGVTVVRDDLEPIRSTGDDSAHLVVALVGATRH